MDELIKSMNAQERQFRLTAYYTAGLQGLFYVESCLYNTLSSLLSPCCLLGYKILVSVLQIENKVQQETNKRDFKRASQLISSFPVSQPTIEGVADLNQPHDPKMSQLIRREIDEVFECLQAAFTMRKKMAMVASSQEHMASTKRIILRKVKQLCALISNIHKARPTPDDLEVMVYLTRMVGVKIELHAIVDVFRDVNWAAVDEAMSVAYKPLEG